MSLKIFFVCVCLYKMVDISAETWIIAEVSVIKIHDNTNKTLLKLLCIYDIAKRLGGKNIYDLIDTEINRKYKIDRPSLFKSSEHSMYVHEDIAVTIRMQSRSSDPKTINLDLI